MTNNKIGLFQSCARQLRCMGVALCLAASAPAQAAFISLVPSASTVDLAEGSTASLQLVMDFQDEPTLGGSVDFLIAGPALLAGFTPSAFFSSLDTAFSGFSTDPGIADNSLAVWFGDFAGLSGMHELGTIHLDLLGTGTVTAGMSANSLFGPFYSADTFELQDVLLSGTTLQVVQSTPPVTGVPEPSASWLLMSGLAAFAAFRRSRRAANAKS
jgi:hypothetical protein